MTTQEEWSYIDSDSNESRNLDALISAPLYPPGRNPHAPLAADPQSTLRYHIEFLMECKQSALPYVMFLRKTPTGEVPNLIGLPHEDMLIGLKDEPSRVFNMSTFDTLGLFNIPFYSVPPTAISMSNVHRKNSNISLSGEEVYRSITLPLMKALNYYRDLIKPAPFYRSVRIAMPIAVIRAPLVGVHMDDGTPRLEALPWVRLVRVNPDEDGFRSYTRSIAFDVVHVDYLSEYISIACAAAIEIVRRIDSFAVPILTGKALHDKDISPDPNDTPYKTMSAQISDEQYMHDWRIGMREFHAPKNDSDQQAITTVAHSHE